MRARQARATSGDMGRPPLRDGRLTTARAGITQPDRRRSPGKRPAASMARTRRSLTPRWRAASATSSISLTSTTIPHTEQLCLRDYRAAADSHLGWAYDEAAEPSLTFRRPINWGMGVQQVGNETSGTFVDGVSDFRRNPGQGCRRKSLASRNIGRSDPVPHRLHAHSPPRRADLHKR